MGESRVFSLVESWSQSGASLCACPWERCDRHPLFGSGVVQHAVRSLHSTVSGCEMR